MKLHSILQDYAGFSVGFLVMNAVAVLTSRLPHIVGAGLTAAAVIGTLLLVHRLLSGQHPATTAVRIGLKKPGWEQLIPGVVFSAVLLLFYPILSYRLDTPLVLTDGWPASLAALFFTGGIAEETLFRGALFGQLRRRRGFRHAAGLSILVFTLAHLLLFTYLDWPVALMSTLLAVSISIPFAFMFEKAGNSIWGVALVHTAIRTIGVVISSTYGYSTLAMAWILCCIVVSCLIPVFLPGVRELWLRGPEGP